MELHNFDFKHISVCLGATTHQKVLRMELIRWSIVSGWIQSFRIAGVVRNCDRMHHYFVNVMIEVHIEVEPEGVNLGRKYRISLILRMHSNKSQT